MRASVRVATIALGTVFAVAACDNSTSGPAGQEQVVPPAVAASLTPGDVIPKPAAGQLGELFVVCKYGPSATFDISELGPNPGFLRTITVNDGECVLAAVPGGQQTRTLQSVENVPSGVQLDRIVKTQLTCGRQLGDNCDGGGPFITVTDPASDPVSGFAGGTGPASDRSEWGLSGVLAEYYNSRTPGEGCTPGYWKQPHHFDSWAGYSPSQYFSSVFENAYPGMTLLQVLQNNGNRTGLEALGRHTVAALLNAANTGVGYGFTTTQVIDAFNAVYPGTKQQYNAQKEIFAAANEAVCPLN